MPLIYCSVSQGAVTLAEYAAFSGNFGAVAREYLDKAGSSEGKFTFTVEGHTFNFLSQGGFTYLAVADEAYGRAIPSAALDKIEGEFRSKWSDKIRVGASREGALNNTFGKQLKQIMEHATQYPQEYSKVAAVQSRVNEVKGIMTDNIDKVIAQGEKLQVLTDKTENLMFEADRFVRTGRSLQRKMWMQNCKIKVVVAFAVLLLGVIIFLLICFSGTNCLKKQH
ncbi:hypothetical protein VOLCADRAFT_70315 [Volvox carteri f. nagariensis]|uniref:Uncharacterized protein vamp71 n=1 Tax=Volvox carteri f. nagariensis TaxID=3068 RepID=D8UK67_VOLCA|nr:uncharacterized protein VOLCADRAFT_70315 [Volvox carteri f. nagariensis]EFJ39874.1 hypothetical protein VOLCADRAFT_70315 [Volvox carteri f. nagariensis]|eukprot:XP_002959051.1 hypothetical protein VOLCADRAFT_70315 [Volvox carteri f. nagariensis]